MERTIWDFWAPRYERLWAQRYSLGPGRDLILDQLFHSAPKARRILDLGCGVGQLARAIARERPKAEVVGLDVTPSMIERAKRDYSANNLVFHLGPLESLPHGDGFDAIVSTHAFPYLPDKRAALRSLFDLLNDGGRLLLLHANQENAYDAAWLFFVEFTTTKAEYLSTHTLQGWMAEAGFRPGVVRRVDVPRWVPSIYLVEGIKP